MIYSIKDNFIKVHTEMDTYAMKINGRTDNNLRQVLENWFPEDIADRVFTVIKENKVSGTI